MLLDSVGTLDVRLRCTDWFPDDATWTTAGTLEAYVYDAGEALWSRAPDLDLAVNKDLNSQAWPAISRLGTHDRLCYIPVGLTVSHGGVTVVYKATRPDGEAV